MELFSSNTYPPKAHMLKPLILGGTNMTMKSNKWLPGI